MASATVQLSHISGDKYFGLQIAEVTLTGDIQAVDHLLLAGLAHSFDGGRKQKPVCENH